MELLKVCDLKRVKENQEFEVEAIVTSIVEDETSTGKKMYRVGLQDKTGDISANVFESNQELVDFIKVYKDKYPIKFTMRTGKAVNGKIYPNFTGKAEALTDRSLDEFTTIFLPDIAVLDSELSKYIGKIKDNSLFTVANACVFDNKDKFYTYPAGISMHHKYQGGLIHHTVGMLQQAEGLMDGSEKLCKFKYNRDLVYTAIIIHDIFKTREYKFEDGNTNVDVDIILGHSLMACNYIHEWFIKGVLDEETERQLMHIVASHHGKLEYNAIAKPATKEALLVHMIDEFNAKENALENEYVSLSDGQLQVGKNYCLDTNVYKPATLTPKALPDTDEYIEDEEWPIN